MRGGEIEYLRPLRRYYAGQLLGLLMLVVVLAGGTGILVASISSVVVGFITALSVSVIAIVLVVLKFSADAVKGTEFLAKAILYVNANAVHVAAPNPKDMPVSQDFFAELARNVYEMASNAHPLEKNSDTYMNGTGEMRDVLLQNTPVAIFVINNKNNLMYLNPSAEKYLTINPQQALNKPFYDTIKLTFETNQTLEAWLNESKTTVATNTQSWDRVKITLEDGKIHYCDMAVRFNRDNPSGVEAVIALFDHTDKYLNDEHGVGTISMAVHELRTPITVMRGYIEVFEEEVAPTLNAEQAGFMRALSAQAQQLGSFISNIQNFSKIEENTMTLTLKSEDWSSIVKSTVQDMQLRAQVRKKQIVAEVPDNLPKVAVDKSTIYEVLINIIENAIKYTHSSEPIVVSCRLIDNNTVETTVTDKGIGIPESLLGNLFERFYRSHRSNASIGGMGLGLYLAKSIVTAHGGQIWVKSVEGKGSTFGFTIPTYDSISSKEKTDDNTAIVRNAHGWIKNHNLYRG